MAEQADDRALVKELAAAVSTQAQVANRTWIALVTVAVIAVLPRASSGVASQQVTLPLGLGVVDAAWFDPFAFVLLVILTIAFSAAHAQQVRAQKLAQNVVDSLAAKNATNATLIHPRELFDMFRLPSVNRVAPLAQSLRGRYQFYATGNRCPAWLRVVSTAYYAFLKSAAMLVYFGVPTWALWTVHSRLALTGSLRWVAMLAGFLAGATLLQLLLTDTRYSLKVLQVIWRGTATVAKA
jgi:ABC-type multidrug transport system fused ATPase/permease subunit